jgi:hypothetical protein
MTGANSEEAPLKSRDDNSLDRIQESLQKIRNNLALTNLSFPERYHRGKLDLHIHIGVLKGIIAQLPLLTTKRLLRMPTYRPSTAVRE